MKRIGCLLVLCLVTAGPTGAATGAAATRATLEAEAHYVRALELLRRNTLDTRREALRALEQATLLEPGNAAYQIALARAYHSAGFLKSARQRYEKAARLAPQDAEGEAGIGLIWRRDWLKYLERASLDRAVGHLDAAVRLDPAATDAWLALASLRFEQGDPEGAARAAEAALRSDPSRLEARLAVAHARYAAGRLAEADSLYRETIPRLPKHARHCFEDISPVATEQDTAILHQLPPAEQPAFIERFWRSHDPDYTTPENEARLEYWARATQAYFLFFDAGRKVWDERGEVYARYGPPAEMSYNPVGTSLGWANVLVWSYPGLGMTVRLWDRLLSEFYMLPVSLYASTDPAPDPDSLARVANALGTAGGRGVFHLVPPGARLLPVDGVVARFEGASGPRLLAQLEARGGPADGASAEWAVLDTGRVVRARGSGALSPSACWATARQVADFTAELAPGRYVVAATVRDGSGRRGILRQEVRLDSVRAGLALSDLVLACGAPEGGPTVRIAPNPTARVPGAGPLTAYFEIYHLEPGPDGLARFEYLTQVRSLARDQRHWIQKLFAPSPGAAVSVSRAEQHAGAVRRQFITVPVGGLASGVYRLEITVRDLVAGTERTRLVDFEKTD